MPFRKPPTHASVTTATISAEMEELDEILAGGSTNAGLVIRVGDTVRRPLRPTSASAHALLEHLERVGFSGAPRFLGIDQLGREILSYVPGATAVRPYPAWATSDAALASVGRLLREYHEAVAGFDPTGHRWERRLPQAFRGSLACHNDPAMDNIVFYGGRAVALIDFDLAAPGRTGWDLAGCIRLWAPFTVELGHPLRLPRALARLAIFADAYGADEAEREDLVAAMIPCHSWCQEIVAEKATAGHETFQRYWYGGGRASADLTHRFLAAHTEQMRAALGID